MSYTPNFLINKEQLIDYHLNNDSIFEWQYYPFEEKQKAVKIINEGWPFEYKYGSGVNIRGIDYAYLPTEVPSERRALQEFLDENEIEYYTIGG